jgi:rhamnulokinase
MPDSSSPKSYLAFDFGAESGRAILGQMASGVLTIREIHRFANEPVAYGDSLHWDVPRLWHEVRKAFAMLQGAPLAGIAVDAWALTMLCSAKRANCSKILITTATREPPA